MIRWAFAAMVAVSVPHVRTQDKGLDVKEITERLQQRYEMIDDATARFEQHVRFGYSSIEQTFNGSLILKKPNHYRIESEHQTIVTDGVTVWAYTPANNQVVVDHFKENQNSLSPEQFILNLPTDYYSTLLAPEEAAGTTLLTLKLTPRDDRSFVKYVKVWVEEKSWMIRKILILDVNDTETTYTIKDMKLNTNVQETAFVFSPPPGTEVVDLR